VAENKMAAIKAKAKCVTVEEFLHHFDDGTCELVRGKVVRMSPRIRHGRLAAWILYLLVGHVEPRRLGTVASELSFVITAEPHTARVPDVVYISYQRLPPEAVEALEDSDEGLTVPPELVVEILSPDDRWDKVEVKVREYLDAGVVLVWVVDAKQQIVHIYRPDQVSRRLTADEILTGEEVLPEFSLTVGQLCAVGSLPAAQ
jgi:Uma2 family endonuclease